MLALTAGDLLITAAVVGPSDVSEKCPKIEKCPEIFCVDCLNTDKRP